MLSGELVQYSLPVLPNCLAMKLASPNDPVVLFIGDGSLGFYLAELDTAVRHGLPVIVVVGNEHEGLGT